MIRSLISEGFKSNHSTPELNRPDYLDEAGYLTGFADLDACGAVSLSVPAEGLVFWHPLDANYSRDLAGDIGLSFSGTPQFLYDDDLKIATWKSSGSQYIRGNSNASFGTTAATLSCWIKTVNSSDRHSLLGYGTDSSWRVMCLQENSGTFSCERGSGQIPIGTTINDGKWHHLALTFSGGVLRGYCDSVKVFEGNHDFNLYAGGSLAVGGWINGGYLGSGESLLSARIYNTALDETQIKTIFKGDLKTVKALQTIMVSGSSTAAVNGVYIRQPGSGNARVWQKQDDSSYRILRRNSRWEVLNGSTVYAVDAKGAADPWKGGYKGSDGSYINTVLACNGESSELLKDPDGPAAAYTVTGAGSSEVNGSYYPRNDLAGMVSSSYDRTRIFANAETGQPNVFLISYSDFWYLFPCYGYSGEEVGSSNAPYYQIYGSDPANSSGMDCINGSYPMPVISNA